MAWQDLSSVFNESLSILFDESTDLIDSSVIENIPKEIKYDKPSFSTLEQKQQEKNFHLACASGNLNTVTSIIENDIYSSDHLINSKVDSCSPEWPGYTPLHIAIENSQFNIATWLVFHGADINAVDLKGLRPLDLAFQKQHSALLTFLISNLKVESENYTNEQGMTYLHIACASGHLDFVNMLLTKESKINSRVRECHKEFAGYTPLHFASVNGHHDIVRLLLEYNVDVTIKELSDLTALHLALSKKHFAIVKTLISALDFHKNPKDKQGLSHFHIACMYNSLEVVKKFIDRKYINLNARISEEADNWAGCTALHIAVEYGRTKIIEMLLEAGANTNARDKEGLTPLHYACRFSEFKFQQLREKKAPEVVNISIYLNLTKIVDLLLQYKADVNAKNKLGLTPLMELFNKDSDKLLRSELLGSELDKTVFSVFMRKRNLIARTLINQNANIHVADNEGETLMHKLADCGTYEIAKDLIKWNVDINAKTRTGLTPLFKCLNLSMLKLLLENGADPNAVENENFSSPLHIYASECLSLEMCQVFKEFSKYGVDINKQTKEGKTILHCIFSKPEKINVSFGFHIRELLRTLISIGCNINLQDCDGKTVLHYACMRHNESDMKLFLEFGADVNIVDKNGRTPLNYVKIFS